MLFAFICNDKPDHLAVRTETRPAHLAGVRRRFHERLQPEEIEALGRIWRRLAVQDRSEGLDEAA